jgi:hypothetical protein
VSGLEDQLARMFQETFGMSEAAARVAAEGRDGPRSRPAPVNVAAAESAALVETVEELARRQLAAGVARCPGETRERVALQMAAWRVIGGLPERHKVRTAQTIEARWPGLLQLGRRAAPRQRAIGETRLSRQSHELRGI